MRSRHSTEATFAGAQVTQIVIEGRGGRDGAGDAVFVSICHSGRFRPISGISSTWQRGRISAVPSFDIVSRIDLAEVDNALAGISREIATRFDFKGSKCTIERREGEIVLTADDDLKLKQVHELLKVHLTRRKVEPGALDYQQPEKAAGNTLRQTILLRQGIGADLARQLVRDLKDAKLKVQAAVQGGELRVTGKKRDDLQAAITLIRGRKIEQPLQYVNFRE
jgi:cyclic-di-GMP-binding protein